MPRVKHQRRDAENPVVYFDVTIGGGPSGAIELGRVVFELYNDIAPQVRGLGWDLIAYETDFGNSCTNHSLSHCIGFTTVPVNGKTPDRIWYSDCRKLQAALHRGSRGWQEHQSAPAFQGLSLPQNHQRFHDTRGRLLQQGRHVSQPVQIAHHTHVCQTLNPLHA